MPRVHHGEVDDQGMTQFSLARILTSAWTLLRDAAAGKHIGAGQDPDLGQMLAVRKSDQLESTFVQMASFGLLLLTCPMIGFISVGIEGALSGAWPTHDSVPSVVAAVWTGTCFFSAINLGLWRGIHVAQFVTAPALLLGLAGPLLIHGERKRVGFIAGGLVAGWITGALLSACREFSDEEPRAGLGRELVASVFFLTVFAAAAFVLSQVFAPSEEAAFAIVVAWPHFILGVLALIIRGVKGSTFRWTKVVLLPTAVPLVLAALVYGAEAKVQQRWKFLEQFAFGYIPATVVVVMGLILIWLFRSYRVPASRYWFGALAVALPFVVLFVALGVADRPGEWLAFALFPFAVFFGYITSGLSELSGRTRHASRAMMMLMSVVVLIIGIGAYQHASGTDRASVPARGTVAVTATRILSDGLVCQLLGSLLGRGTAEFESTLEWLPDGARISSGEFSCALRGNTEISSNEPCRFMVGGGRARTAITCPSAHIHGKREENTLHLSAGACRGNALGCDLEADLKMSFTPR